MKGRGGGADLCFRDGLPNIQGGHGGPPLQMSDRMLYLSALRARAGGKMLDHMNCAKLFQVLVVIVVGLAFPSKAQAQQGQNRPNIVFIFSDDHAYQAVSAYGFGLNKTPNIDRIANEGMRFD